MSTGERSASVRPGVMLALIGGLLAAIGSPLPWLKATFNAAALGGGGFQSKTANGFDGDGWITLVAGLIVLFVGIAMWSMKRSGKGLSVLVALGGLVAGGTALYDMLTAKTTIINEAASQAAGAGVSVDQVKALLNQAFDQGVIKISPGIGIFVVIAGGAIALVGGLLLLASRGAPAVATAGATWESAPAPPAPMPPAPMPPVPGPAAEATGPEPPAGNPPAAP